MELENLTTINGPNLFHYQPVIKMTVDLLEYRDVASCDIAGFIDALLGALPGLRSHTCSKGYAGGFVERLRTGTYLAHITEHVILELTELAGFGVTFGKTVYAGSPGLYHIAVRFTSEGGTRSLCVSGLELVNALLQGREYDVSEAIARARRLAAEFDLGPSSRAITDAADRLCIPWRRLNERSLIQLGYGKNRRLIQATETSFTGSIAVDIAKDKSLTKSILAEASIPVPEGKTVATESEAVQAFYELGGAPVTVKPLDGNQGRGVSLSLRSAADVRRAFAFARESAACGEVIVEEFLRGKDYRIVLIDYRFVAASERVPASVVGDGKRSISELIAVENENPLRGDRHDKPLSNIIVDENLIFSLQRRGLSLETVPGPGERVALRETANLSTGGIARDVTDEVHPDTVLLCERAARAIGLDVCGVDLITPDISQPLPDRSAGIVEVNAAPGIRMHHFPGEGSPRDVGGAIVKMLYPDPTAARIPIIAVTGTNGKTTTARLIAHVLGASDACVGLTTTEGIYVGRRLVSSGDTTGALSAMKVLSDPAVDVAVLEVARGGIMKRGLGYDWSDVGIVTNISADHLGQDGLETLDDIIHVKSLVAERVKPGGSLIVNGDDPSCVSIASSERVKRTDKKLIYFSRAKSEPVRRHLAGGGTAFLVEDGHILEAAGDVSHRICPLAAIPLSLGGAASFQVENIMAAVAACRAEGMTAQQISAALHTFSSDENSGRMNLYSTGLGTVVLDYAHNPGSFAALSELTGVLRRTRRVTGVVTIPGDRTDALIEEGGRQAARVFDRIIVREDVDRRGRRPGEIAGMIFSGVRAETSSVECEVVTDEADSLRYAVDTMQENEVIFYFYERKEPVISILEDLQAERIDAFPEIHAVSVPETLGYAA